MISSPGHNIPHVLVQNITLEVRRYGTIGLVWYSKTTLVASLQKKISAETRPLAESWLIADRYPTQPPGFLSPKLS